MYQLSDYNYNLPSRLIAQTPVEPADSAKLFIQDNDDIFEDKYIYDLPNIVSNNDVLFFNDTRVVKARIPLQNTRVVTRQGREVCVEYAEIFFLEKLSETRCEALISLLKRNRPGTKIYITETITAEIIELTNKGVILDIVGISIDELLEKFGTMPLPPYITTTDETQKKYQTVFAKHDGSVAAPTASLHFTPTLLENISQRGIQTEYVTLHVGLGTFKPVDTQDIRDYHIHEETIIIDKSIFTTIAAYKVAGKNIVSVGTTVSRVLETLPYVRNALYCHSERSEESRSCLHNVCGVSDSRFFGVASEGQIGGQYSNDTIEYRHTLTQNISLSDTQKYILELKDIGDNTLQIKTRIFIYPGFERKIVDLLMTNFHLPGSTLLMLVASFIGYEKTIQIYQYAIEHDYRFFSFGDAMLLKKK